MFGRFRIKKTQPDPRERLYTAIAEANLALHDLNKEQGTKLRFWNKYVPSHGHVLFVGTWDPCQDRFVPIYPDLTGGNR